MNYFTHRFSDWPVGKPISVTQMPQVKDVTEQLVFQLRVWNCWNGTVLLRKRRNQCTPVIKLRFKAGFSDPLCLLRPNIVERIAIHLLLPVYSSRLEIKGKTVAKVGLCVIRWSTGHLIYVADTSWNFIYSVTPAKLRRRHKRTLWDTNHAQAPSNYCTIPDMLCDEIILKSEQ